MIPLPVSSRPLKRPIVALVLALAGFLALPVSAQMAANSRIRVAGAQLPVGRDIEANVAAITRAIDFAAREKADVLVTPEGSLSGYVTDFDAAATDKALKTVLERAKAARVALVLGTCFQSADGRRYDAQRFYDKDGSYLGFHAKILLCRRTSDPLGRGEIDSFQTSPLRTFNLQGLTVGGLVCNDMWANPEWTPMDDPHLSQKLSEMGARMVFVSANTGRGIGPERAVSRAFHDSNVLMRARAGKLWLVVVNAGDPDVTPNKILHVPSGVVTPDGTWAVQVSPIDEQFFVHTIDIGPRTPAVASQ
jgi:predicted amidohydrolase